VKSLRVDSWPDSNRKLARGGSRGGLLKPVQIEAHLTGGNRHECIRVYFPLVDVELHIAVQTRTDAEGNCRSTGDIHVKFALRGRGYVHVAAARATRRRVTARVVATKVNRKIKGGVQDSSDSSFFAIGRGSNRATKHPTLSEHDECPGAQAAGRNDEGKNSERVVRAPVRVAGGLRNQCTGVCARNVLRARVRWSAIWRYVGIPCEQLRD
jgi:hypothetical protein